VPMISLYQHEDGLIHIVKDDESIVTFRELSSELKEHWIQ